MIKINIFPSGHHFAAASSRIICVVGQREKFINEAIYWDQIPSGGKNIGCKLVVNIPDAGLDLI